MFAFNWMIWTQHILSGSEPKWVEQKNGKARVEELLKIKIRSRYLHCYHLNIAYSILRNYQIERRR